MAQKIAARYGAPLRDANNYPTEVILAQLRMRNINFPGHKRRSTLISIIEAADKGLVRYETLARDTLADFMGHRRIKYTGPKRTTYMIPALREADEERTLPRFMELPAEIREVVYEYAMMDPWQEPEGNPAQSALTRVSRLIRSEVVYIACKHLIFGLSMSMLDEPLGKSGSVSKWLRYMTQENFACMQHLDLILYLKPLDMTRRIPFEVSEAIQRGGFGAIIGRLPAVRMFRISRSGVRIGSALLKFIFVRNDIPLEFIVTFVDRPTDDVRMSLVWLLETKQAYCFKTGYARFWYRKPNHLLVEVS